MNATTVMRWILAGLVLTLAACSSNDKAENPNVPPTNYKTEIIGTLRELFVSNDTASVSNAFISDPAIRPADKEPRYTACVRYTAHGISPGAIGNAVRVAYFYGGRLNQLLPAKEGECDNVAYKPFPELDRVCLGKACNNQGQKKSGGFGNLFGR